MSTLPTVGNSDNTWGTQLNGWLSVARVSPESYYSGAGDYTLALTGLINDINAGRVNADVVLTGGATYEFSGTLPTITAPFRMYTSGAPATLFQLTPGLPGLQFGDTSGGLVDLRNFNVRGNDGNFEDPFWPNNTGTNSGITVSGAYSGQVRMQQVNVSTFAAHAFNIGGSSNYFMLLDQCGATNVGGNGIMLQGGQVNSVCRAQLCNTGFCGSFGIYANSSGWTLDRCQASYTNNLIGLWSLGTATYLSSASTITLAAPPPWSWQVGNVQQQLVGTGIAPGTYITSMAGNVATLSTPTIGPGTGAALSTQWVATDASWDASGSGVIQFGAVGGQPVTHVSDALLGRAVGGTGVFDTVWQPYISSIDTVHNTATVYPMGSGTASSGLQIGYSGCAFDNSYGTRWIDLYTESYFGNPGSLDLVSALGQATGTYIDITAWTQLTFRTNYGIYPTPSTTLPAVNSADANIAANGFYSNVYNGTSFTVQGPVLAQSLNATGTVTVGGSVTPGWGGTTLHTGAGAPTIAGTAGFDWYLRTDTPGTVDQRLYICTVTGGVGTATWVGFA